MITMMAPLKIRQGTLKDCKDLLTVYQTTRWFEKQYTTVEEVKAEHQGKFFRRWGWMVAEVNDKVIGEIIFRTEESSTNGTIGNIVSVDVDVRYQKKTIGKRLVSSAEEILKERGINKVVTNSTPQAYNFWMKLGYFSRQSLLEIETEVSTLKEKKRNGIKASPVKSFYHLPYSLRFSNIAPVGVTATLASPVIDKKSPGSIYEFFYNETFVGVGVITKFDTGTANFVVDVVHGQEDKLETVVTKIIKLAKRMRANHTKTIIPKTMLGKYEGVADWSVQDSSLIPVTRLL